MRLLLVLFLTAFAWLCGGTAQAATRIENAEVTMTLVPDPHGRFADAQVIERLSYDFGKGGSPGGGSQLVAPWKIEKPVVIGADGFPLRSDYDPVEGRIRWDFPPEGTRSAIEIRYTARAVVQEGWQTNAIRATWMGKWNHPVGHLAVTVLFPQGFVPQNVHSAWEDETKERPTAKVANGLQALTVEAIAPSTPFALAFTPKLVSVVAVSLKMISGATVILLLTIARLRRLPVQPLLDLRDPTPTEVAFLATGLRGAILTAHFDLLQRGCLTRVGNRLQAIEAEAAIELYEQIAMSFYQSPQPLLDFFMELNSHPAAFEAALKTGLSRKGLLREQEQLKACGYELLGYLGLAGLMVLMAIMTIGPWSQVWIRPWLLGAAAFAVLFSAFAIYFVRTGPLSRLGMVKLAKFERLARQAKRIDPDNTYRPQLAYAAAVLGFESIANAVPADDLALFLPLDGIPASQPRGEAWEAAPI